jgi:uncharacterized protein
MGRLRSSVCDDLSEVDREEWNALARPTLYLSYDWLAARSDSVGGPLSVVLVHDEDGRLVAGAPCYLTDESAHPRYDPVGVLTEWAKPEAPQWRRLRPALVVAAPSLGGGVAVARQLSPRERERVLVATIDAVEALASEKGARLVAWLYLPEGADAQLAAQLSARRYLSSVVEADCYLPIRWSSFDGYLEHLKASGRRMVRAERRALASSGARIELGGQELLGPQLAGLEAQWRRKYGRSDSLAEIEREYELLRRNRLSERLRVFVARRTATPIGFAAFFADGDTWYARFLGRDYEEVGAALYFNLMFYAPIEAAIDHGVACVRYSFESYDAKRRRGCLLHNVLAWVQAPGSFASEVRQSLTELDERRRAQLNAFAVSHVKARPSHGAGA